MKKIIYLFIILFLIANSSCDFKNNKHLEAPLIPRPSGIYPMPSSFTITKNTVLLLDSHDEKMLNLAHGFKVFLDSTLNLDISIQNIEEAAGLKNVILLSERNRMNRVKKAGYHIEVDKDKVVVQGKDFDGVFNAVMTLKQMILLKGLNKSDSNQSELLNVQIWDQPQFDYRGVHLDVCRHFFPISFVKKYLDIMALYKFNYFHWHLTEDQAWRIEIKAYPELTNIGAWRTEKNGERYGGFYTQEEIKEIVAYAKKLNITVIPEIEMPGHSRAALAAYPNLSCTGKKLEVPNKWGVFEDVYCAGNEETFRFLETVLDEVMELFPSEYIHIGGDESPKSRWEKCSKCQKRIQEEGLANEHELQSYFVQRIEKYLNAHGRRLIGWDEILEGGLAPDATVMSWRGVQGGIDAAREEHQVIMSPGTHCYFDHYQADPEFEPKAIGGYTPLSKVYSFNPIPQELNKSEQEYIWGGQANMWTEYMDNSNYVEYMLLPRMIALSEALWSREKNKSFKDFNERLQTHKKLLDKLGYHYSNGSYKLALQAKYDTADCKNMLSFVSEQYKPNIKYTIDSGMPLDSGIVYNEPFSPKNSCVIKAGVFEDGKQIRKTAQFSYVKHLGLGQEIHLLKKASKKYSIIGSDLLLDGIKGTEDFSEGRWLGFEGKDLIAEINLKYPLRVEQLSFSYVNRPRQWILAPKAVRVYARKKNERYNLVNEIDLQDKYKSEERIGDVNISIATDSIVALKIVIENYKKLPDNHKYAGEDSWIFIDELVLN